MMLNLITDRTQYDVDRAEYIMDKARTGGYENLIPQEKREWLDGFKACYDYQSYNRLEQAVLSLEDKLKAQGYQISLVTKIDWNELDMPTEANLNRILSNVNQLKDVVSIIKDLPTSMNNITYEGANEIEKTLMDIEMYIEWMLFSFRKCGTFKSGSNAKQLPLKRSVT